MIIGPVPSFSMDPWVKPEGDRCGCDAAGGLLPVSSSGKPRERRDPPSGGSLSQDVIPAARASREPCIPSRLVRHGPRLAGFALGRGDSLWCGTACGPSPPFVTPEEPRERGYPGAIYRYARSLRLDPGCQGSLTGDCRQSRARPGWRSGASPRVTEFVAARPVTFSQCHPRASLVRGATRGSIPQLAPADEWMVGSSPTMTVSSCPSAA